MATSLLMKIFRCDTPVQEFCQWLMLAQTPMDLSFSCVLFRLAFWMANTLCSVSRTAFPLQGDVLFSE